MKHQLLFAALIACHAVIVTAVHAEEASSKVHHEMKADTNQDGVVSFDEFKAMHEKRLQAQFKRMDTNGDGVIDQAEKQAVHDKMREMRQKRQSSAKPESDEK